MSAGTTPLDAVKYHPAIALSMIARGLSNAEIGHELYISETTVKTHVTHVLQKLDLRDRVQAVVLAYQTGLFETDQPSAANGGGGAAREP